MFLYIVLGLANLRLLCRPYFFQRIPYSNLLLLVIDASQSPGCSVKVSAQPTEMGYDEEFPCYKLSLNDLERRRLDECFTEHPEVSFIRIWFICYSRRYIYRTQR